MKKNYIKPEIDLIMIDLSSNLAFSVSDSSPGDNIVDVNSFSDWW